MRLKATSTTVRPTFTSRQLFLSLALAAVALSFGRWLVIPVRITRQYSSGETEFAAGAMEFLRLLFILAVAAYISCRREVFIVGAIGTALGALLVPLPPARTTERMEWIADSVLVAGTLGAMACLALYFAVAKSFARGRPTASVLTDRGRTTSPDPPN